jgi:hypothetical protein
VNRAELSRNPERKVFVMKLTHCFTTSLLLCAVSAVPGARGAQTPASENTASAATRDRLAEQVDRNVDALERAMATARRSALSLDAPSRMAFKKVSREAGNAAHELHKSLIAAQRASDADWERARSVLASDYERFAQAVAQAQRIATLGNSRSAQALTLDER